MIFKKYAGLMLIVMCITLVGCSSSSDSADDQIPTSGKIIVHQDNYQDEYEMRTGKYESDGENVDIRSMEEKSVLELAKTFNTLGIDRDVDIEIRIEEEPSLTVLEWNEDGQKNEITLTGNTFTLPSNAGIYIYEVQAKWSNGEAAFVFDVEVK